MSEETFLRKLYSQISRVREMTGGCNIQGLDKVKPLLRTTIEMVGSNKSLAVVRTKLIDTLNILESAKVYKDRLKADCILCDILNTDLLRYG